MSDWRTDTFEWQREQTQATVAFNAVGHGPTVVFLPALSSISTHREMWPLMERLSKKIHGVTVDWPGFGDVPRARHDCSVAGLSRFLDAFVTAQRPMALVAAGHAATYALQHAAHHPGAVERLVLVAPTWRGPLPTMAGGKKPFFDRIVSAIDMPSSGKRSTA